MVISALYSPPRHAIKKEQHEDFFKILECRFIAGGDFNAKHPFWGSCTINPKGRELIKCIQAKNLLPTYWPSDTNKFPDVIDFCVCKGVSLTIISSKSCLDLSSDYSPIIVWINANINMVTTPAKLHNERTNWALFKDIVECTLPLKVRLKCEQHIAEAVEIFNTVIQNAGWKSTPINVTQKHRPYLSIWEKIKAKRKVRKKWQENRSP